MSKLDELLRELCPDGVEYKRFDEVCTLNARIGWQRLTKAEYMSKGDYLLITERTLLKHMKLIIVLVYM